MLKFYNDNNYIIYSDGKIWSKNKKKFLKTTPNHKGYPTITMDTNKRVKVHLIIAIAFLDWRSDLDVNHINENRADPRLENLEMLTRKENIRYSQCKKIAQYDLEGNLIRTFEGLRVAEEFGFNNSCISKCCKGKIKTHKGFIWKYA